MNKTTSVAIAIALFLLGINDCLAQVATAVFNSDSRYVSFDGYFEAVRKKGDGFYPTRIKDQNLDIKISYIQNKPSYIKAKRFVENNFVEVAEYAVATDGKMYLVKTEKRPQIVFFDELDDMFDSMLDMDTLEPAAAKTCDIKVDKTERLTTSVNEALKMNSSCLKYKSTLESSKSLVLGSKSLAAKTKKMKSKDEFINQKGLAACLVNERKKLLKEVKGLTEEKLDEAVDKLVEISNQDWNLPKDAPSNLICLEGEKAKAMKESASSTEDGKIEINLEHPEFRKRVASSPSANSTQNSDLAFGHFVEKMMHEYLHLSGFSQKEEKVVESIVEICEQSESFSLRKFVPLPVLPQGSLERVSKTIVDPKKAVAAVPAKPVVDPTLAQNKAGNTAAPVGQAGGVGRSSSLVASAKAVDAKPAPEINQLVKADASGEKTATLMRANELETVVAESRERTEPIRSYVGTSMDAAMSRAEASGGLASSEGRSNTRTPASAEREPYQRQARDSKPSEKGSSLGKQITGRDGEKYTVVEEYLAKEPSKASGNFRPSVSQDEVSASATINSSINRSPSNTAAITEAPTQRSPASVESASVSSGASAPVASSSGLTSSVGSNSGGRSPASVPSRRVASEVGSSGVNELAAVTADYIKATPYSELRSQYRNPDFKKRLIDADITIMNSEGKYIGAPKGQIRYLDKGDRVIRMK